MLRAATACEKGDAIFLVLRYPAQNEFHVVTPISMMLQRCHSRGE
jgi:hypothetical protein